VAPLPRQINTTRIVAQPTQRVHWRLCRVQQQGTNTRGTGRRTPHASGGLRSARYNDSSCRPDQFKSIRDTSSACHVNIVSQLSSSHPAIIDLYGGFRGPHTAKPEVAGALTMRTKDRTPITVFMRARWGLRYPAS
jgi:hypothetical protein